MPMENEGQTPPDAVETGYKKAARLIREREFDKAKKELERLLSRYPQEDKLLILMGNVFFESGEDLDKAEEYYREALRYEPENVLALTNLGMLFLHQKRFDEAVELARKAIQKHASDPRPWIILGLYYVFKGQIETALGYLLAAYSHDNRYNIAGYNAACALIELGRLDEAFHYLEVSLSDGELYFDALNDQSLDPIRDDAEFKRIMTESKKASGAT